MNTDIDSPLSPEELSLAALYWNTFVGNPIGERPHCWNGCKSGVTKPCILSDSPGQTERAAQVHLVLAMKSECHICSNRHFIISEALSHHSELLRCNVKKDSKGALEAARRRCALLGSL